MERSVQSQSAKCDQRNSSSSKCKINLRFFVKKLPRKNACIAQWGCAEKITSLSREIKYVFLPYNRKETSTDKTRTALHRELVNRPIRFEFPCFFFFFF